MESISKRMGKKFKLLLENMHVTQEEAATLLEVDERTIRRWIKDGIDRISIIEEISNKFNVDVMEIFFNF